jgi:hypothetical protein
MGILSILFKIGVDATKFETDLKRVQGLGEKFGNSFKSAITSKLGQALTVGAVLGFSKSVMDAADQVKDLSEQLNITTNDVQRLQILSSETGITFDQFAKILEKTAKARIEATSGDETQIRRMKALGASMSDLTDDQIQNIDLTLRLAKAHKESGQSAETTTAITELYGLKLRAAAVALADFENTANRDLISEKTIADLSKSNDLLDEQYRRLKAISSPSIAAGLKVTADALENLINGANTAAFKTFLATTSGQVNPQKAPFFGAAVAFSQTSLAKGFANTAEQQAGGGNNPPAIGKPEFERVAGPKFSFGSAQDSLARIGGFTGFQSSQDTAIRNAIEQTLQLKLIVKNTDKTANNTRD